MTNTSKSPNTSLNMNAIAVATGASDTTAAPGDDGEDPYTAFPTYGPPSGDPMVVGLVNTEGVPGLDFPDIREARVGGLAAGWIILGVLVFPAICIAGWLFARQADRNEDEFVDLVERS